MQSIRSASFRVALIALILIVSLSTSPVVQAVSAQSVDSLDIPATYNVNPGASFTIDLLVANQTGSGGGGLGAFDISLQYDSAVLTITNSSRGPALTGGWGGADSPSGTNPFLANGFGGDSISGSFTLLTYEATAANNPGSTSNLTIAVTNYGDEGAEEIPIGGDDTRTKTIVATGVVNVLTPPTFSFGSPTATVAEGDSGTANLDLTVNLAPATGTAVSVDITTAAGTASSDTDYGASEVTVTASFGANETTTTVSIPIKGDTIDELDETFTAAFDGGTNTAGTAIGLPSSTTVTILDDDAPPTVGVRVAAQNVTEGDAPTTTTASVDVDLSSASGLPVTVHYTTSDTAKTATEDTDYVGSASMMVIAAGATTGSIDVTVNGDDA